MPTDKDWTGNAHSTFSMLGASNHSEYEREEHDYYATEPAAVSALLKQTPITLDTKISKIWEPACGAGNLSEEMKKLGYDVYSTDKFDHEYGLTGDEYDFLTYRELPEGVNAIITNPPYKFAYEFCEKCVELGVDTFAMLLKTTFLEGKKRRKFYDKYPPKYVCVFTNRISCARNNDFKKFKVNSAACYSWFIWEKGFTGRPQIIWIQKEES